MNSKLQGEFLEQERLANYTTWRVGGLAKSMYKPRDIDDLALYLSSLPKSEPVVWLGLGSNSLIRDGGVVGTVILTQGCLDKISVVENDCVLVEAGVSCAKMARFCARNNLSGGEFWAGIPGTMGGALRMNAGCFNGETWQHVVEVLTINRAGVLQKRYPNEFDISYRSVFGLADDEWFVAAKCKLYSGDKDKSLTMIKELLTRRTLTQPTSEFNCGSVFRNPVNNHAARLIEECNLKGYQIGGAQVSTKHANFIINVNGNSTAEDIESLIEYIRATVYEKTNINLIREVHILGESKHG